MKGQSTYVYARVLCPFFFAHFSRVNHTKITEIVKGDFLDARKFEKGHLHDR